MPLTGLDRLTQKWLWVSVIALVPWLLADIRSEMLDGWSTVLLPAVACGVVQLLGASRQSGLVGTAFAAWVMAGSLLSVLQVFAVGLDIGASIVGSFAFCVPAAAVVLQMLRSAHFEDRSHLMRALQTTVLCVLLAPAGMILAVVALAPLGVGP